MLIARQVELNVKLGATTGTLQTHAIQGSPRKLLRSKRRGTLSMPFHKKGMGCAHVERRFPQTGASGPVGQKGPAWTHCSIDQGAAVLPCSNFKHGHVYTWECSGMGGA